MTLKRGSGLFLPFKSRLGYGEYLGKVAAMEVFHLLTNRMDLARELNFLTLTSPKFEVKMV